MKKIKRVMFYSTAYALVVWMMSLHQTVCDIMGAGVLIAALRWLVPTLVLNYKLWNVSELVIASGSKKGQRRKKMLFWVSSAGILLSSFNHQLFVPLAILVIIALCGLYLPIIARGRIWEEELVDVEEGCVWRA